MALRCRLVVAVLSLALSAACSTTHVVRLDTGQGEPLIHTPRTDEAEPVELGKEEFTKAIAKEFAARGVTSNAVAPGFIKTDMTAVLPTEAAEKITAVIPLKRLGEAADIAHMTAYLCSEEAGYITGQVFAVDGGMVM